MLDSGGYKNVHLSELKVLAQHFKFVTQEIHDHLRNFEGDHKPVEVVDDLL